MAEHPAVLKSQELWSARAEDGTMRDLEPCEEALLRRVSLILACRANSDRTACKLFGEGSGAAEASRRLAQRQEQHDLTAALESYERHLEPCP